MTSPSDPQTIIVATIQEGFFGGHLGRFNIVETDDYWVFEFGVEGGNIGLWTVNLDKDKYGHCNIFGLLEYALMHSPARFKNANYHGERLTPEPSVVEQKEITS